jgi:rhomboid protease GluP
MPFVELIPEIPGHPYVSVLLSVAKVAPEPWFFRQGLAKTSENKWRVEQITEILDELHKHGYVERREGTPESGPGVVLTEKGRKTATEPIERKRLADLADNHFQQVSDTGLKILDSIRPGLTPWLARALVLLYVGVFSWGLYKAYSMGRPLGWAYFTGFPSDGYLQLRYFKFIHNYMGSLLATDLLDGAWWRVATNSLLSLGGLNLLLGIWIVWGMAANGERYFGRWRLLMILILAEWGCVCMGLAMAPVRQADIVPPVQGSSGVFAGLIGAMGAWTLMVSHHLPAEMARGLRTQLIINVVIIAILSFMPGASPWAYAGGAIGGALAVVALHLGRFGPTHVSPLAYLALPGIVFLGYWYLQSKRETSPEWVAVEEPHFKERVSKPAGDADKAAHAAYRPFSVLFDNFRRTHYPPERVEEAVKGITKPLGELEALLERVRRGPRYQSIAVRRADKAVEEYLALKIEFYRESIRALELGGKWTERDEAGHREINKRLKAAYKEWDDAEKEIAEAKPKKKGAKE